MTGDPSADSAGPAASEHEERRPGRSELGTITFSDRVVVKIAAQAVTEVPDAGSAAPRLLGRPISSDVPGIRQAHPGGSPKVDVDVDQSVASIMISIGVRWPASVPEVSAAVRAHVIDRLAEMTGLTITDVRIHVSDLIIHSPAPPRVR